MNQKNVHGRKIDIAKNIDYMMEMVKEYLTGATPRYIFELDFETEILSRYRKMARENKEYAELFYDLISEGGVDAGADLSDKEFMSLIRRQYNRAKTKLHICGNTTPFLADLPAEYCDIIDLDWMVPLEEAVKIHGNTCALAGNYDPVAVLLQGTPETIRQAVIDCAKAGGSRYISAAGCEVPRMISEENFLTVKKTLDEIGG
jgi:uroporphyrinogen-III decarboxylase